MYFRFRSRAGARCASSWKADVSELISAARGERAVDEQAEQPFDPRPARRRVLTRLTVLERLAPRLCSSELGIYRDAAARPRALPRNEGRLSTHRWLIWQSTTAKTTASARTLICFLALVVIRLAETRSGETWRTIRAELGQIRQGHFRSSDGEFTQTSELTPRQRELHASLGIPEPPRFGRITPAATAKPA